MANITDLKSEEFIAGELLREVRAEAYYNFSAALHEVLNSRRRLSLLVEGLPSHDDIYEAVEEWRERAAVAAGVERGGVEMVAL